jgi:hypothetical protein
MAEKKTVVCGIYQNPAQAERVVPDLVAAGFSNDAISLEHEDGTKASEKTAGGTRLSVHCVTPEEDDRAKDVLKRTGAKDISSSAEEPDQVFVES